MTGTTFEAHAKELHEDLLAAFRDNAKAEIPTVVTVFSLHSGEGGQWIIGDDKADRKLVADRLRLCADLIERKRT